MTDRALGAGWGLPLLDERTREFFTAGRLRVQACSACGGVQHPPEDVCRSCGGGELGWRDAGETGTVESRIVVHHAVTPALAGHVPYVVLLVAPEGASELRLVGNLVGAPPEAVSIGDRVRVVFETVDDADSGETLHIPQWTPA
jgi:uncharacterized OB-fold protein